MSKPILEIKSLCFAYKQSVRQAIDDFDLNIDKGDSLGLIGINGAGKTTLVSLVTGLLKPKSGSILIDGSPAKLGRLDLGLVPQEYAFYNQLSAQENLNYFASILQLRGASKRESIQRVIKSCHLKDLATKPSNQFSGGEKRRLNLAIALLKPCKLLILDEPTANVDPHSRATIIDLIKQQKSAGTTIIYTSHLLSEVESLCQSVALIHNSQLKSHGNLQSILSEKNKLMTVGLANLSESQRLSLPNWLQVVKNQITIDPKQAGKTPSNILHEIEELGLTPVSIQYGHQTLENLFMQLTHE